MAPPVRLLSLVALISGMGLADRVVAESVTTKPELAAAAIRHPGIRSHVHAGYLFVETTVPESIEVDLLDLDGGFLQTLTRSEAASGGLRFRLPSEAVSGLAMVRVRRIGSDGRER